MAVALTVTATSAAAIIYMRSRPVGLVDSGDEIGGTADRARIGRAVNVGTGEIVAVGDKPVHIESVEVLGLPDGLRLKGVYAEEHSTIGVLEGDLTTGPDARDFRPVTEAVFEPGQPRRWFFVVVVVPEKVGVFQTEGIRVKWRVGRRTGYQTYHYWLRITVA